MWRLEASAPRWNSSNTVFLVGYILTRRRRCKSEGRKGKEESELFQPLCSGQLKADGVQSSCSVRAGSLLGLHQPSTKSWQVNPGGKEDQPQGTDVQIFSLLSFLMAFLLLRSRMPRADVHQEPRQTTNGQQKPATETDPLTWGELKGGRLIELPSCMTRGWVQTPLLLL